MSRAPLALIRALSSTVMLPGTAAGACFRRVAVRTSGSAWLSLNKSSASAGLVPSTASKARGNGALIPMGKEQPCSQEEVRHVNRGIGLYQWVSALEREI